jgi:transposase InsO family protein
MYPVKTLCDLLDIHRSTYYHLPKFRMRISRYDESIKQIFVDNYKVYGARKIRVELKKLDLIASRHKIREVMRYLGLVSKYVLARRRRYSSSNVGSFSNLVKRYFKDRRPLEVVAGDVVYVHFGSKRYFLCILLDIATRMIVGWAVNTELGADLVEEGLLSMNLDLSKVTVFHTDRGSEFNNIRINEIASSNGILRSLSAVAAPLDNAVVESMNNIVKIEWKYDRMINSLSEFKKSWSDYVFWYNNQRIHGSLGYKTPAEFLSSFANAS